MTETNEEISNLAEALRGYLESYIVSPTGGGYHFLRNKIAEYYSISAARSARDYAKAQNRMRDELTTYNCVRCNGPQPDEMEEYCKDCIEGEYGSFER